MVEAPHSSPCKRRRSAQESDTTPPSLCSTKRRKLNRQACDAESRPRTAFWDSLSKIWLTRRALKELNRRTTRSAQKSPFLEKKDEKRLTRSTYADWERSRQPAQSAWLPVLNNSNTRLLNEIKRFARHGSLDLLDLRVACIFPSRPGSAADLRLISVHNLSIHIDLSYHRVS